MKRLLPAFLLVLALLALAYLLLPRGHTFYGTRLLNPKPVDFANQTGVESADRNIGSSSRMNDGHKHWGNL